MAKIFVSHSSEDADLVSFFAPAFFGRVEGVFEEFERIISGAVTADKVKQDIEDSNAVFVILSQNVQAIPHTRDWIVWETGVAANKDIWIFEPTWQFGRISVAIPFLRHYVLFDMSDDWRGYIMSVVNSYDDSHVLPTALLGGGIGAALDEKVRGRGALLGLIGGFFVANFSQPERPKGVYVACSACHSMFSVHAAEGTRFRCPVCNAL